MALYKTSGIVNPEPVEAADRPGGSYDERYQRLARSVGCISANGTRYGTGWVIAENKVITNAHVAKEINRLGTNARVTISFENHCSRGTSHGLRNPPVHWEEDEVPDVAIYEFLSAENKPPDPIPRGLSIRNGQPVVLIGYALRTPDEVPNEFAAAWSSLQANRYNKVFSPGQIADHDHIRVWHTSNTVKGFSGSVVVAENGGILEAIGVHDCGEWVGSYRRRCKSPGPKHANMAWTIWRLPAIDLRQP